MKGLSDIEIFSTDQQTHGHYFDLLLILIFNNHRYLFGREIMELVSVHLGYIG